MLYNKPINFQFRSNDLSSNVPSNNFKKVIGPSEGIVERLLYKHEGYNSFKTSNYVNALNETKVDGPPVMLYFDGDLTIPVGTILTPKTRCQGLYIFVNGTLTNNGKISMTQRGAKHPAMYVWLDLKTSQVYYDIECKPYHEHLFYIGKTSGDVRYPLKKIDGVDGCCGSGGCGVAWNYRYGANIDVSVHPGGNGTAFSGGAGGGTRVDRNYSQLTTIEPYKSAKNTIDPYSNMYCGSMNGGQGGARHAWSFDANQISSPGVGNDIPRIAYLDTDGIEKDFVFNPYVQYNPYSYNWGTLSYNPGGVLEPNSGTGGLIVIFARDIINNGTIESKGTTSLPYSSSVRPGGGSGGGSINLFYMNELIEGDLNVIGGNTPPVYLSYVNAGEGSIRKEKVDYLPSPFPCSI